MSIGSAFDQGLLSPATVNVDSVVSDEAVAQALVSVELALISAYERVGAAPRGTADIARSCFAGIDLSGLASAAVHGGNPVIPLVPILRRAVRERSPDAATWVHRGATSPEILDTALMLIAATALDTVVPRCREAARVAADLADRHRETLQVGRTLTQHSTPIVFGAVAAQWSLGLTDAADILTLSRVSLPIQLGGASGNLASFVEIAGKDAAGELSHAFSSALGLRDSWPWLVRRTPVTRLGDALVTVTDTAGVIASDVATLSRSEIAELEEGATGGSSTMPQKRNPVSSVLLRSIALRAPGLGSDLHRSAALSVDQRPDGAWHAEWPSLRELLRLALGASDLVSRLLRGLHVDSVRMAQTLQDAGPETLSERVSLVLGPAAAAKVLTGDRGDEKLLDPSTYVGLSGRLIDAAMDAAGR